MSQSSVQSLPVNRREVSYYVLFGTIALFAIAIAVAGIWMLLPAVNQNVVIGSPEQFPPSDVPILVQLKPDHSSQNLADFPDLWLVNLDGTIKLFHRKTPVPGQAGGRCIYSWNDANQQFEDPCSGSHFRLDGTVIRNPAASSRPDRDLDEFAYSIENGQIIVDKSSYIMGACRVIPDSVFKSDYYRSWDGPGDPTLCDEP